MGTFAPEIAIAMDNKGYEEFIKSYPASKYFIELREPTADELDFLNKEINKEIVNPKKIVRVEKRYEQQGVILREVYLTTYKQFLDSTKFRVYNGSTKKLYPYRWYNINALIEIPVYYLLRRFNSEQSPIIEVKSKSIIIAKLIIYMISAAISIKELVEWIC